MARPRASFLALRASRALALLVLVLPPAALAITGPGGNGVAKDRGLTLSPPWGPGRMFTMTCGYGCGRHDNIGTQDYFALDFPMAAGEPIFAAAAGRVILAESLGSGWEPYGTSFPLGGLVTSALEAVRAGSGERILMFTWGTGGLYFREQSTVNGTSGFADWVDLQVLP
jgi:hypothetical protein